MTAETGRAAQGRVDGPVARYQGPMAIMMRTTSAPPARRTAISRGLPFWSPKWIRSRHSSGIINQIQFSVPSRSDSMVLMWEI